MVTMSQKSSLPQAAKSVSLALTPDNSGAADEERAANRIAEQQDELDRLIKQRDAFKK